MKRILFAVLVMSAIVPSCQHDELEQPVCGYDELYAVIEDMDMTRTYKDDFNQVLWSEDDKIVAFMKSTQSVQYKVKSGGKTTANFVKVSSDDLGSISSIDHVVAYYPYSDMIECEKVSKGYSLNVELPSEQVYAKKSFGNGSLPMASIGSDNDITFSNVSGAMKLQLKGTAKVMSVKVEGKNNEKLSGAATVTVYTDGSKPSITMKSGASSAVELDCGDGVQLSEATATEFIISLPPVVFSKGFVVTVTDASGFVYTIDTDKQNEIKRSSLLVMPEMTLDVSHREPVEGDYVDEYGINHGPGVEIDGVVWAPVNCGYHATDYKYGKLYQWGRKYGQGYSGALMDVNDNWVVDGYSDATVPTIKDGGISLSGGQSKLNSNVFFCKDWASDEDWVFPSDGTLWNSGTESDPVKTAYDPCPKGWRVPTSAELDGLYQNHSSWTSKDDQPGCWCSGLSLSTSSAPKVFLPAAGFRGVTGDASWRGKTGIYWTSRPNNDKSFSLDIGSRLVNDGSGRSCGCSVRCVYDPDSVDLEYPDSDSEIPVSAVVITSSSLELYEGNVAQLTAGVRPIDASYTIMTWSSDTPSVATVDQTGLVTVLSAGEATITASVGGISATCSVTVLPLAVATTNYVDEYGKDHGKGIVIGKTVWAPVNCGYHATDYKYGKLYQWGRKYGQGYSGELYDINGNTVGEYSDATVPTIGEGGVSVNIGNHENSENTFYIGTPDTYFDWVYPHNNTLWNSGTESKPVKTDYDPCPDGWRVPTSAELEELCQNYSSWTSKDDQPGCWFSGLSLSTSSVPQVFLPAAGFRSGRDGIGCFRGWIGYYWSSKDYDYDNESNYLCVYRGNCYVTNSERACGFSVRCVQK